MDSVIQKIHRSYSNVGGCPCITDQECEPAGDVGMSIKEAQEICIITNQCQIHESPGFRFD